MTLKEKLSKGVFCHTAEIFPPKGTDTSKLVQKAELLKNVVDAVNVTDNQRAVMRLGGIAVSRLLLDMGIEPVFQLTARDRNRLALQSDLLAAYVLGIRNVLLLSGDHPTLGDHKSAMPVYDLDTVQLISAAASLNQGQDMNGKDLRGKTDFNIGAVTNPNLDPFQLQLMTMGKKISAGASFIQTQVCFDFKRLDPFVKSAHENGVKILPSIAIFSSLNQLDLFRNLGIQIPTEYYERLKNAKDILDESIRLNAEFIKELRKIADGVHIIAINIEENIPRIFDYLK